MVEGRVELVHGAGGRAARRLIETLFRRHLDDPELERGDDAAHLDLPPGRLVMSTDAHVVSPLFFPGGDIGSLAVHGSVNDVAMAGARPLRLSAAFILEEGLALADLERIAASMGRAAREAGVRLVAADTKVVERGKGDGLFITTTAVGVVPEGVEIGAHRARPGDAILLSGAIGNHGVAVMASREGLAFERPLCSDSAPLADLVAAMVAAEPAIRCLRDPTRGGLATALNEVAAASGVAMTIREEAIPVDREVAAACELLGLDPLYLANEGKLLCIAPAASAPRLLEAMRAHPLGRRAALIGEVVEAPAPLVTMETAFGGRRVVDWLAGDPLPRIC